LSKGSSLQKVAVDTNFLVALVDPKLSADSRARIDAFLADMEKKKGQIVVPMPALAEFLAGADQAGLEYMDKLERRACIEVAPFDRRSATECALLDAAALGRAAQALAEGKDAQAAKKDGGVGSRQKVKVDRQIVAIAKACGARAVISGDDGVRACALRAGLQSWTIHDLPLPDSARQSQLQFEARPGA
jgi:predicted nucleic acid-binding protein